MTYTLCKTGSLGRAVRIGIYNTVEEALPVIERCRDKGLFVSLFDQDGNRIAV